VTILRANRDVRAVRLEPGRHTVAFELAFPLFAVGAGVSVVTLLGSGLAFAALRGPGRSADPAA
jgi:hypothetical protein